jgi:hypothetical protein
VGLIYSGASPSGAYGIDVWRDITPARAQPLYAFIRILPKPALSDEIGRPGRYVQLRVSLLPRRRFMLAACPWALSSKSMGYGEWNDHLTIMIVI